MIFGGVLTTLLSWRWVFLVNVPVGVAAGLLAPRLIPAVPAAGRRGSLDPFGALSLVAGLAVLVYALSGAAAHGWGSARTRRLLALSVALLVAFAAIERTVAEPLIPPAIWRVTQLVSGAAIMLGATGILAGTFFLVRCTRRRCSAGRRCTPAWRCCRSWPRPRSASTAPRA